MKCTICSEIIGDCSGCFIKEYVDIIKKRKNIICSTEHFVILPSLGALNKSHILLVPKEHYLSFSRLPRDWDDEIYYLKQIINAYIFEKTGKKLLFFEHGVGTTCDTSGACIEHAHLHGIWYDEKFIVALFKEITFEKLKRFSDLHNKANNSTGYIFIEYLEHYWLANNPMIPSQYFRFLYSKINNLDCWDWRKFPNIENIKQVLNVYNDLEKYFKKRYITNLCSGRQFR